MFSRYTESKTLPDRIAGAKSLKMTSSWLDVAETAKITFGLEVKLAAARITVYPGSELIIGGLSEIRGRIIVAPGCKVVIGEGLICNSEIKIHAYEGSSIYIGRDCLFANPQLFSSDMHSIFSEGGDRLNQPRDIVIGDRVWLATNTLILKGSNLSSDTVVGAGAVVSGKHPAKCVLGGNPAKVIKSGTTWSRFIVADKQIDYGDAFSSSMLSIAAKEARHLDVIKMAAPLWDSWRKMDESNSFIFYYFARAILVHLFKGSEVKAVDAAGVFVALTDVYDCLLAVFKFSGRRNFPCGSYAFLAATKLGLSDEAKRLYDEIHPAWSSISGSAFQADSKTA